MKYFLAFLFLSFIVSFCFVSLIKYVSFRWNILDRPSSDRKIHKEPIPLLGGMAVFLSLTLAVAGILFLQPELIVGEYISPKALVGLLIGGALLMLGGFLDDKYILKPSRQIVWPILAAIAAVAAGIGIPYITNPFGGTFDLTRYEWVLFWQNGIAYKLTLLADLFTFVWLMGMMYTTKFLDGLDGLVTGVTLIGSLIIFILSLTPQVHQPETALLALLLAGACAGFLVWNWHPAKIFLGEGGSLFLGFMLGSLAIISGSKVATTLLIVGLPILDVLWVIVRRIFIEKKSPFSGDRKHFHHRLLDAGFSHRGAVIFLCIITALFGASAIFLQTEQRLLAFLVLIILMVILSVAVVTRTHLVRKKISKNE